MREKLEELLCCSVSRYLYVGVAVIITGFAFLISGIKGGPLFPLFAVIAIIVISIGAGVIVFLFLPVYRSEQKQRVNGVHQYIGAVIYDASDPDATPKTSIDNVLPELSLSIGTLDKDGQLMKTLSPQESVALETLFSTTASSPYGSILHPENPKPVNYGRTMDRGRVEPVESEDMVSEASVLDATLMQSLSVKEQAALGELLSVKETNTYESILHPKNPKPVNYGRRMEKEDDASTEPIDNPLVHSGIDETLMQSMSLKEQAALGALLNVKDTASYESVLHPKNPKPVNYGKTMDGEGE